jgi:hypothetical protein
VPPAANPETGIPTKQAQSRPADPPARPSPPCDAWERSCRRCTLRDGAVQTLTPASPAAMRFDLAAQVRSDAPRDSDRPLRASGGGGGGEQGPVRAGLASARSDGPPKQSAADGDHGGGTLAQAEDASGWAFWADWVKMSCSQDDSWSLCCAGDAGTRCKDRWGGDRGGDEDGGGGGGGGGGVGGGDELDLGAAGDAATDAWFWSPMSGVATVFGDSEPAPISPGEAL